MATNICTLKINNALKSDLGNYLVLAENKAGKDQTFCKIHLTLLPNVDETPLINPDAFKFLEAPPVKASPDDDDKDKERYFPPNVIVPLENARLTEGDPVRLTCKIDGYPKPKVTSRLQPISSAMSFAVAIDADF